MDFEKLFNDSFEKNVVDVVKVAENVASCRSIINEKFGDINFLEESHQYFIGEQEYTPVSSIIKRYETYVDWDAKAADNARRRGLKKEDVQREWRLNNLKSTISGTRTHAFGESYTNLLCGFPEKICEQNMPQYVKEYNVLIPTYPKEDAVKKFYDELDSNLHPVGAEFRLSSKYVDGSEPISGTCDLLFYDSARDGYVIGDWKTNRSLVNEYRREHNIVMEDVMKKYIDDAYSHYTLQFNLYQRMLESVGLKILDRMLIWLKDDGTYEKFYTDKIDDDVLDVIMKGGK